MGSKDYPSPDLLEVLDAAVTAALREIRRARARSPLPAAAEPRLDNVGTSCTKACLDILTKSAGPLHISVLLVELEKRGIQTTRDSLVSALSKKLTPHGFFCRTAPNTFGLAARDLAQGS